MFEKTDFSTYIKNAFTIGASGSIMREDDDENAAVEKALDDIQNDGQS